MWCIVKTTQKCKEKQKFKVRALAKVIVVNVRDKPAAVCQHLCTFLVEDVNRPTPPKKGGEKLFNYEVKGIGEVKEENMPFYPFTRLRPPRGERCRPRRR